MKYPSIIFIIAFTLNCNFSSAQIYSSETEKANKAACIKLTRELVTSFKLNENEYIKLKNLNMLYLSKVAESNTVAQLAPSVLTSPLYKLEVLYEQELVSFLTPYQLQAYRAYKETNKSVLLQLIETVSDATGNTEMVAHISRTH